MERADALVVGGGPAGSTCAWALGQAGLAVTLLDRAAFPRDKPCAGWITPQVLDSLELDPEAYAREGRTLQPITGFRVGLIDGRPVEVDYGRPVSWGVRRCEFDDFLLRRSGARVLRHAARRFRREGGLWIVDDAVAAPLLIGAGGGFCPVSRLLDPRPASEPVVAREIELPLVEGSGPVRGETPELYFCDDLLGYGWCFRKGDWLNVGLGRRDPRALRARAEGFARGLEERGRVPPLPAAGWRGHAYRVWERGPRRLADDGVLLVGDAAGLASAASGEGIRAAVESGLLAARSALEANGRYDRARLGRYVERLAARLGAPAGPPSPLGALPRRLVGALLARPLAARHLVVERLFLRRGEPALRRAA